MKLDRFERVAYLIDLYRVVPRIVMGAYGVGAWLTAEWFMGLSEPSGAQSAFVSVVAGIAPILFQFYAANGIDWEKRLGALWPKKDSEPSVK